jgi:hypothetical protein
MNGLYPIIRRVRRPLLPVDWPADAKPVAVPVTVSGEKQGAQAAKVKQRHGKADHGEATSTEPAR